MKPNRPITLAFCLLLATVAQAAQAHKCTMSDVAGKYGYTSNGSIVNPAVGLFTGVGEVTVTETGTLSGTQTTSIAGNISVDEIVQGTLTLNPNCTGTLSVFIYHGSTLARSAHVNMVWDDHAREVRGIFLTAGTAITIIGRKMFRDEDDD